MERQTKRTYESSDKVDGEDPPNLEEINEAILKLKYNRVPGEDRIEANLKYREEEPVHAIIEIIQVIWDKEEMPNSWNAAPEAKYTKGYYK
ncbi:hypothetical protein HHI36_017258 [Cryptolaemus montrouzieri]|uniref:Uncharacterized protein n=1 Tax=Cryptolaemus montrouzieri TaxID=559131 RepID=A0ABD2NME8_9CUCU